MTTASEAMAVAQSAQDEAHEARREVAGIEGRLGALEAQVSTHRTESQAAHTETQRMVGELALAVAHLKGAASAEAPKDGIVITPAVVVRAAKWLLGAAAALGIGGGALHECSASSEATAQADAERP